MRWSSASLSVGKRSGKRLASGVAPGGHRVDLTGELIAAPGHRLDETVIDAQRLSKQGDLSV